MNFDEAARYMIVTSARLTRNNKKEVVDLFGTELPSAMCLR
jgi:hypothetical protein